MHSKFLRNLYHGDYYKKDLPAESIPATPTYLYSKFNCDKFNPLGKACPLELEVGGVKDGKKHKGFINIADEFSHTRAVPVFINYRLLTQPDVVSYVPGSRNSVVTVNLSNVSSDVYEKVMLEGVPDGAKIVSNSCTGKLIPERQCSISFDLKGVSDADDYEVKLYGITADSLTKPLSEIRPGDVSSTTIKVMP